MSPGEDSSKSSEASRPEQYAATPLSVAQILDAQFVRQQGMPSFLVTPGGRKVTWINLIAVVVDKPDDRTLLVDDGTGIVSVSFSDNSRFAVGDVVHVRGRSGEVDDFRYILPDFVRGIDNGWLTLRKFELEHRFTDAGDFVHERSDETPATGEAQESHHERMQTDTPESAPSQQNETQAAPANEERKVSPVEELYSLIREMDSGSGVDVSELMQRAEERSIHGGEGLLQTLLEQGDIFLPRAGLVKTLE